MLRISRVAYFISMPCIILSTQAQPVSWAQEGNAGQESRLLVRVADGAGDPSSVVRWNIVALETTGAAAFNPLRETRSLAIVSAAVFDAVNSITRRYEPYAVRVPAQATDSAEAAVHAAAHDALVALYPDAKDTLDTEYERVLAGLADRPATTRGIEVGQAAAAALLALRSFDHSSDQVAYEQGNAPGAWRPTPPAGAPALEPGWGKVTPFFLEVGSQFRPGPPPALTTRLTLPTLRRSPMPVRRAVRNARRFKPRPHDSGSLPHPSYGIRLSRNPRKLIVWE
jgi:hypothetical protein